MNIHIYSYIRSLSVYIQWEKSPHTDMNKLCMELVQLCVSGANKECDKVNIWHIIIFTFIFQRPLPLQLLFSFKIFSLDRNQLGKDARSGRAFVFVLGHNKSLYMFNQNIKSSHLEYIYQQLPCNYHMYRIRNNIKGKTTTYVFVLRNQHAFQPNLGHVTLDSSRI